MAINKKVFTIVFFNSKMKFIIFGKGEYIMEETRFERGDESNTKGRSSRKIEGLKILRELFAEKPKWDKQSDIMKEMADKGISAVSTATLYRWLIEIGAKPTMTKKGQWVLEKKDSSHDLHLSILESIFQQTRDERPIFFRGVKVAVLQTKPNFNRLTADAIQDAFEDEVICVFCPDDINIVIYYKIGKDENGKTRKKSRLGEEISALVRKIKQQNKKSVKREKPDMDVL
jgi:arginine repressor